MKLPKSHLPVFFTWIFSLAFSQIGLQIVQAENNVPAFPSADGYGAATVGGRGGSVISVTNLNASGPGSLQSACEAKGARIVVFKVAGTIDGDIKIQA